MPSFPTLTDPEIARIDTYLGELCAAARRTGADLYAGNCASCHAGNAAGGRNALDVRGPDIRCTGANDYQEKVREGDDDMPAFPRLGTTDVAAIASFVHGAYCAGE
jgi:mono/diheme cytochrome c family protein